MILHTENSKDTTREWFELINEFGKIAGYKINKQKSVAFPCPKNEISERDINLKKKPLTIMSKIILGISLPKGAKSLHSVRCVKTVRF